MKLQALILALLVSMSVADLFDCSMDAVASQSDDGATDYAYCDVEDPDAPVTTDPATLTVNVAVGSNEWETCLPLSPNTPLADLEQFGLFVRPYFRGEIFVVPDSDPPEYRFGLGQYGDENCFFRQRYVEGVPGEDFCLIGNEVADAQVSEIYWSDLSACQEFEALSAEDQTIVRANNFEAYQENITDVWEILTSLIAVADPDSDVTFEVENQILLQNFVMAEPLDLDRVSETILCYGVGNTFAPPFNVPTIAPNGGGGFKTQNRLFAPSGPADDETRGIDSFPGKLCGIDCSADILEAFTVFETTGSFGNTLFTLSNSTCGRIYGLRDGAAETPTGLNGGLTTSSTLFATFMLDLAKSKECNTCITDIQDLSSPDFAFLANLKTLATLFLGAPTVAALEGSGAVDFKTAPVARMHFCDLSAKGSAFFYIDQDLSELPADPTTCSSPSSALHVTFGLLVALAMTLFR